MLAARAVAALAAHVPLCKAVIAKIEVYRMAAVAGCAGWALEIIRRIERRPPVRAVGDEIGPPDVIHNVPLRGLRIVVAAHFGEVALLPNASVNQANVAYSELFDVICGEVGNYGVGMFTGITNDVGHRRFLPAGVNISMTALAGARAHVLRRELSRSRSPRSRRRRLLAIQQHYIRDQQKRK